MKKPEFIEKIKMPTIKKPAFLENVKKPTFDQKVVLTVAGALVIAGSVITVADYIERKRKDKVSRVGELIAGLAGVGDLIVTCCSMHSRNRRAGILIGQGKTAQEAMTEVGAVVEGYYAARSAIELARKVGVEMPITEQAYEVLYHDKSAKEAMMVLMHRQKASEAEDVGWA